MQVTVKDTPQAGETPQAAPATAQDAAAPAAPAASAGQDRYQVSGNTTTFTTEDGLLLKIKKMGPSDRMRMFSIIGPENSKNDLYLYGHAVPAYSVLSINNEPVPRPQNVLGLEALADRMGDNNLIEIMTALAVSFGGIEDQALINDLRAAKGQIKNS